MDTQTLLAALRGHYIAETVQSGARDGGVFAHEVAINGDWGGPGTRRADALYAGFTSASGRILVGHEIKVSRADWRAELAKVGKADRWADACHAWYIVAPSTAVVPLDELPEGWGLMLPPRGGRARRMRIAVKATVKVDHSPPWWAVRSLMARLDTLDHERRNRDIRRIVDARQSELEAQYEQRQATQVVDVETQRRLGTLESLERALGMGIESWRSRLDEGKLSPQAVARGARIAALLEADAQSFDYLDRTIRDLETAVSGLKAAIPEVQALAAGEPVASA